MSLSCDQKCSTSNISHFSSMCMWSQIYQRCESNMHTYRSILTTQELKRNRIIRNVKRRLSSHPFNKRIWRTAHVHCDVHTAGFPLAVKMEICIFLCGTYGFSWSLAACLSADGALMSTKSGRCGQTTTNQIKRQSKCIFIVQMNDFFIRFR